MACMRLHRFLTPFKIGDKNIEINDKEIINQISHVLRLSLGDRITITNGCGLESLASIKNISKTSIEIELEKVETKSEDVSKEVTLYLSILKKDNFELVVQKAVELGVLKIVPIITTRTIKTNLNFERLKKIIKEATEQSGRVWFPEISDIKKFEDVIKNDENKILFNMDGIKDWKEKTKEENKISIFVGPEGGWTEEESNLAKNNNAIIASLGSTVLRAETAAIVATFSTINY